MCFRSASRALAFAAAGLAFPVGCSRDAGGPPARPNVVLVTLDTARADRLGCYGHRSALTPTLDGLAARGVRFETAVAHAPLTAPSHASMLTGLTPLGHGVRDNGAYVLPSSARSVAEDFRHAGYRTAAFVSGFPLKRRFGFDQGFDVYDDNLPRGEDARRTAYVERVADRTTDAALRWLEAAPSPAPAPVFLWVHYFDPHAPYEAPAAFMAPGTSPYDGEIAFVDAQLGRLLRGVDETARGAPILVLVTADHGESLGEHGEDTHGIFVYDATLRVPFLLAGAGVPSGVVATTVARGIDVAPTLLDYAGLTAGTMEGRSLRPAASGERMADEPAYAESLHSQLQYGWAPLHAWRTSKFKLIEAPRAELYDLEADPAEAHDRAAADPSRLESMRRGLQRALSATTPDASQEVDAETAERLAALGYVGTGGSRPTGRDPKDGIALVTRLGRNGMTVARTEPEKAIRELTALLAEDPGMFVVLRTRAVAYAAAGRHAEAVRDLRELEKRGALSAEDAVVLGDNLRLSGRVKEAVEVLRRTVRENASFAQPLLSLAAVHVQERDLERAAAAYGKVLALEPDNAEGLRGMGDLALIEGDLGRAGTFYARILEHDEADVGALTKLGVVRMRAGRRDEAISLLRRAVERDPGNAEALLYLAGALASTGRPGEAVPFFERALRAGPRTTMALNGLGLTRLELGDRGAAAAAFRESLRLDPNQPEVARTLRDLGRP
ncbi:MAG TPA: sulfatase-like hydrolase/transferase [Vicinamibacteria bacterium]|nr:sulfatase-like hydrolase/transferase [Vicinamibacteria bacterium]